MIMNTNEAVKALKKLEATLGAYSHVLGVTSLDASTAAPKGTSEGRGQVFGILSEVIYGLLVNPENEEILVALEADKDALDAQTRREAEQLRKEYDKIHRVPAEEYVAYQVLLNDA